MQGSSEQPLVGEERYVTTLIMAAKETMPVTAHPEVASQRIFDLKVCKFCTFFSRIECGLIL